MALLPCSLASQSIGFADATYIGAQNDSGVVGILAENAGNGRDNVYYGFSKVTNTRNASVVYANSTNYTPLTRCRCACLELNDRRPVHITYEHCHEKSLWCTALVAPQTQLY